jgi:hypothetical protein
VLLLHEVLHRVLVRAVAHDLGVRRALRGQDLAADVDEGFDAGFASPLSSVWMWKTRFLCLTSVLKP